MDVGGNRVRGRALSDRRFRNRVIEAAAAMADIEMDAAFFRVERGRQ